MGRKRVLKVPNSVKIRCPHCGKNNQIPFTQESVFKMECRKCKKMIETPIRYCCLICASGKKCYSEMMSEARLKKLDMRF